MIRNAFGGTNLNTPKRFNYRYNNSILFDWIVFSELKTIWITKIYDEYVANIKVEGNNEVKPEMCTLSVVFN